ncbi:MULTISPECIES: serine/threonine-protein kinase [Nonomuraea]|jgi:predicted Ser/Thr protein kinase|uniref:Serine/threonine-protein kinase n=1 Tax=Nonomuraea salmonea TaxID=46181 RepID=A0ABV5NRG9_9ACTN
MESPQRVGPYTLIRKLGEGGMGVVHLAHDPAGRPVALKTMRADLAGQEEFRRRFGKESEAARRVARFCTAPVLDAGFHDGVACLVTEYVEGPDLSSVVARAPLAGSNLEALAVGVATALAAIHAAGVVHRDLKPSNVLLSPLGPRVIDFGIAQLADAPGAVATVARSMGTPAYMSPEQARGEHVTPASDVFSWGSLVAYAGTGRPPFGTGGVPEVVYRVINHAPVLDGLDERVRPLVERALAKDPARRPTAQQLIDTLLGRPQVPVAAATQAVSETWTPVVVPPAGPPQPREPAASRRLWATVAVGVLAAVLGAAVTLAVVRPWERPDGRETVTTVEALGTTFEVRIDSLVRQGRAARLQWTVRNVGKENAPLYNKFGRGALDRTVSQVSLIPPGVGDALYPAVDGGACRCASLPTAPFNGGDRLQLWAVYEGLPEDADRVDVSLGPLGLIKDVAVEQA